MLEAWRQDIQAINVESPHDEGLAIFDQGMRVRKYRRAVPSKRKVLGLLDIVVQCVNPCGAPLNVRSEINGRIERQKKAWLTP